VKPYKPLIKLSLIIFLVTLALGVIFIILPKIYKKSVENKVAIQNRQLLALTEFKTIDDQNFSIKGAPVIIIFFSSMCPFCVEEIETIQKNKALFAFPIIMISDEDTAILTDLALKYGIDETSPIKLVSDGSKEYHKCFQPSGIPSIFIYNASGGLKKHFQGETKVETLIKYIQ
jgi:thiol-disulfide isomerase/thioredoxin